MKVLLLLALGVWAGAGSLTAQPVLTVNAPSAKALIPKGWRLLGQAQGDLNQDKRPDLALVLASTTEREDNPATWEQPRYLAVALATGQSRFQPVLVTSAPVLTHGDGGLLGDPFQKISIQRGTLVIDHEGGSRDRWAYTDRYRYQTRTWVQIGRTERTTDSLDPGFSWTRDHNLLTGLVIETQTPGQDPNRTPGELRGYKQRFYELPVAKLARIPPGTGPWPGLSLMLQPKVQLQGVVVGDQLYLQARVQRKSAQTLRLINAQGQVIPPTARHQYPLRALGVRFDGASFEPTRVRVSVEISTKTLSTSQGGRRYPVSLWFLRKPSLPLISEVRFF